MAEKMRMDDERIFGITKLKLQAFSLAALDWRRFFSVSSRRGGFGISCQDSCEEGARLGLKVKV